MCFEAGTLLELVERRTIGKTSLFEDSRVWSGIHVPKQQIEPQQNAYWEWVKARACQARTLSKTLSKNRFKWICAP